MDKTYKDLSLKNWMNEHFKHELEYCLDFGVLGFEDWTSHNDEGLTWALAESFDEGFQLMIFIYRPLSDSIEDLLRNPISYGIHLCESQLPIDELFETDVMGELWSVVRSNLDYFNELLTKGSE